MDLEQGHIYHLYNQGNNHEKIFFTSANYSYFLKKIEQHIAPLADILAWCLMPNHFHLLLYQIEEGGMSKLMHGIMTSYSLYFNHKYGRTGPLFESRYKGSRISSDEYLLHISRYIHRNPDVWIDYPHSSIRAYLYNDIPKWMNKSHIVELYGSAVKYHEFLEDYLDKNNKIKI